MRPAVLGRLVIVKAWRSAYPRPRKGGLVMGRRTTILTALAGWAAVTASAAGAESLDAAPGAEAPVIALDAAATKPVPSTWAEYFGVHYGRADRYDGPWFGTVRGYGGPHVGLGESGAARGAGQPDRKGPFTGRPVRLALSDIRRPRGSDRDGMDTLIDELIARNLAGVYVFTSIVRPSTEPFDKNLAYWAARLILERHPKAADHVLLQLGNEINGLHFDPAGIRPRVEQAGESPWKYFNRTEKVAEYVEGYLAPAVEAIRRASKDACGDERRVTILSGSVANIYSPGSVRWMRSLMDHRIEGRQAPSLAGTEVWKHVDILTVHYPFGGPRGEAVMQDIHDAYLKTGKVEGVWVTEEHGASGKGAATVVTRAMRFMAYAAANGLNARQARLVWWGAEQRKPGGAGIEAVNLLGRFLSGGPLRWARRRLGDADATALVRLGPDGAADRILLAIVPDDGKTVAPEVIALAPGEGTASRRWSARAVRFGVERPPVTRDVTPVMQNGRLTVPVDGPIDGPWVLFAEAAESQNGKDG